jgi:N-acetylglutamate synthase-like GNAT family acetyltransferase
LIQIKEYHKDDYFITNDINKVDREFVCSILAKTYWAASLPKKTIEKSLQHAMCFSLYHWNGLKHVQVGMTRVITDYATFAYVCDVVVAEDYRHKKLGSWLIDCVLKHPDLQNIRRWYLVTNDAQTFYKKFGFMPLSEPARSMEMVNEQPSHNMAGESF